MCTSPVCAVCECTEIEIEGEKNINYSNMKVEQAERVQEAVTGCIPVI